MNLRSSRWSLLAMLAVAMASQAASGVPTPDAGSSLQTLISHPGMALIALGFACIAAEALLPSYGVVGIGGIVACVVGALLLVDSDVPGFARSTALIAILAVLLALLVAGALAMAIKARRRALVGGDAGLVGSLATVTRVTADAPRNGMVQAQGEQWQVQSVTPLRLGQQVRITARQGLILQVSATAPAAQGE